MCVGKKKRKTSKSTTNDDNDDDVLTNRNNNNINVDDNKLSGEGGGRKLHNGHSRGEVENTEEQDVVPDLPNYDSTYGRVRRLSRGSISTGTVNTTTTTNNNNNNNNNNKVICSHSTIQRYLAERQF